MRLALVFRLSWPVRQRTSGKFRHRVKWSGVGLALGSDNPPVQQINEAVRQVLDNPSFATKAAMLEKEFRSHALRDKIGQLFMDLAQQDRIRRPS